MSDGRRGIIDLPSWLAYACAPILPVLKRAVRLRRAGGRGHRPRDILLPEGYVAEVVATGLNTPVHCCFDDQGACYVIECGHKVEVKPRIVRVDLATGAVETFFDWPADRWIKTGAVTGGCWHAGYLYVTNTNTLSRIGRDRQIEDSDEQVEGTLVNGKRRSTVDARVFGRGRRLGNLISRLWPRWTWTVQFPSGGRVRALILATPRVQVATIRGGQIALETAWLPAARRFLPLGVYLSGLRMQLSAPNASGSMDHRH